MEEFGNGNAKIQQVELADDQMSTAEHSEILRILHRNMQKTNVGGR